MPNLSAIKPLHIAMLIAAVAFATIAGAWIFEAFGYLPCELCLKQRYAYYAGVPLALATAAAFGSDARNIGRIGLLLLVLVWIGSSIFGIYHSGVEWGFWTGPTGCTGSVAAGSTDMSDFMKQLQTTQVVRCDAVAIRILGLSLAGWNAIISAALAALAALGFRRA